MPVLRGPGHRPLLGLKRDAPGKVIRWDAEWGEDFEVVGNDPLEVWLGEKRKYDNLGTP